MKKQIVIAFSTILIIVLTLSGCDILTEQEIDIDKIKILSYQIETWGATLPSEQPYKISNGFIYNQFSQNGFYKVTGSVKNNAGVNIPRIKITINFYDIDNNYLTSKNDYIISLTENYIDDFTVIYWNYEPDFEKVNQIEIEVSVE